jgi:hypothetical protein
MRTRTAQPTRQSGQSFAMVGRRSRNRSIGWLRFAVRLQYAPVRWSASRMCLCGFLPKRCAASGADQQEKAVMRKRLPGAAVEQDRLNNKAEDMLRYGIETNGEVLVLFDVPIVETDTWI